jgi:hypothetical protein
VILDEGGISVDERVPMLDPVRVEAKPPVLEPVPPEVKPRPIEPQRDTTVPVRTPLRPWMRPVGFAALGVGAVGFVVGGVLGGVAISRRDASNTEGECKADGFCNARGVELREEMLDFAHVSTAGWITGGVFATSGAILLIAAARPKKDDMKRGNVTWQLGVIPGGMSVQGVW